MQLYQNEEIRSKKIGLVLQPVGQQGNEELTILKAVHLDDLSGLLTNAQFSDLEKTFPNKQFLVWGISDQHRTNENFHKISPGFDVFFYKKRNYFLRAKIACKFHNSKVASILWKNNQDEKGRNFNNLYFCPVESLENINLSVFEVNEVLESKQDRLYGMTVCVDEEATALLKLL
ncbi:hypothetical protein [Bacillus cereus]|uniref:hypothetical protein n=1 Tax=Bacillus cereus TaxID=1396 RepID=UPI00111EB794|nr:hypothetical protein [Bacillus cereus]TNO60874.1 hypothetical protein FHR06_27490 [Bacillus cereus]